EPVKQRLLRLAGHRADQSGVITIEARSHRSQHRNREDARRRLADLIEQAHRVPRRRIATRPTRSAKKKRLKAKRQRAVVKQKRAKPGPDE
ncbi:MAG: aminoacyl-tRNA hydrolase, partial [Xanthomonadaceae bacterium]|nr:aminoacyl-tRNA hydrolase [Xanthomonadaceae bacterium]